MTLVKMNNGIRKRPATFLDGFFGDDFFRPALQDKLFGGNSPAVNVVETADAFRIDLAAPGLKKSDFKLALDKDILTIKVEKVKSSEEVVENDTEKETEKFLRREYDYNAFERSFQLPKTIDNEKIEAKYEDGVLLVTMPKREEALEKPMREITIS